MHVTFLVRSGFTACLMLAAAAAHAAAGITVTQKEAAKVVAGMSASDVRTLLGNPASNIQYRNEPGPVWLYNVTDAIDPVFFEISFGADGKVRGTSQYVDPSAYTGK